MSSFEFISILMSILIGLGVTNLLAGAGRAFYRRQKNQLRATASVAVADGAPALQFISVREFRDDFLQSANDQREAIIIEFVGRVGRAVVMRITKWRGVGDHNPGITVLPKCPLVRPRDAGNERRQRCAFGWEFFRLAEDRD